MTMSKIDSALTQVRQLFKIALNSPDYSAEVTSMRLILVQCPCLCPPVGHSSNYHDLAQDLRQRITSMKIKIDRQLGILAALKDRVKDQVVEMQRLEVCTSTQREGCSAKRPQSLNPRRETKKVLTCGYKSEFIKSNYG